MVLKPLIGALSDRWGRRLWLIIGTAFFAFMPFLYRFVQDPEQLFGLRIIHGLATAIYGPVTVAFVAERFGKQRAEKLGWFGMARSAGYIIGPAVSGWLLLTISPVEVYTVIGLLGCFAFVPVLLIREPDLAPGRTESPLFRQIVKAVKAGVRFPSVWLSGGLELTVFIALYAAKAFLPVYALSLGFSIALVGIFFSIQEGVHILLKPAGGRIGDRLGYFKAISLGMILIGLCLPFLTLARGGIGFIFLALLIGCGQSLVFPSTLALVSRQIDDNYTGTGMGLIGMLRNAGKVIGPILGGGLIHWFDFTQMFWCMGIVLFLGAGIVWYLSLNRGKHIANPSI